VARVTGDRGTAGRGRRYAPDVALPEKQHSSPAITVPGIVVGGVVVVVALFVAQAVIGFVIGLVKLAIVVGVICAVVAFFFRDRD
jgi:hypothetical protein